MVNGELKKLAVPELTHDVAALECPADKCGALYLRLDALVKHLEREHTKWLEGKSQFSVTLRFGFITARGRIGGEVEVIPHGE